MNQSFNHEEEVNYFTKRFRSLNDDNEEVKALRKELHNLISDNFEECLTAQSVNDK